MKSKITVILAMLLLITLSGCNNTRQKEDIPEPFSSSESSEQTSRQETLPAKETSEVESTPEPSENAEPEETQSITEAESTDSSKPKEPEQTVSTVSAPQNESPQETESITTQTTPPETQTPPPAPPAQTEAAESTETTETTPPPEVTPEPKSIYDYEFDVEAIRQEMIAVGEGMGLTHTDGLTPDTASWAIPVTASADFQGENLKRRLTDYVQSMPELITAYGGEPIQSFTIYAEPLGGGSYRFYFLY